MTWIVLSALLIVLAIGVGYRAANSSDGISFRIVQFIYFSFGSIQDFQRRDMPPKSLLQLANEQPPLGLLGQLISKYLPGEAGWFQPTFPTDKGHWHNYLESYDYIFANYRDQPQLNILEIGVKKGGSIALWRQYFQPDAFIYGIDVNPFVPHFRRDAHIKTLIMDSRDEAGLKAALSGIHFDIIVDDGLHEPEAQWKTYQNLRPHLKDTGVYLIEDVYELTVQRYQEKGDICVVIPDPSGQYLQVMCPKQSLAIETLPLLETINDSPTS